MATTKAQRWGIIIVLLVTVSGTLGSFAVMVLSTENSKKDQAERQRIVEEYQKIQQSYQAKVDTQTKQLSDKYYPTLIQYKDQVATFDRDGVTTMQTEDLQEGTGEEIKDTTAFAVYYIGWNPKGKIFDQSIDKDKLKAPLLVGQGLKNASVITGWKEGIKGMKVGGVRKLVIPSDKAYGETGQGDDIPANTPLSFVVMAIPMPPTIAQPDTSKLTEEYMRLQ